MSNQIGSLKMGQKFKKTPAGEIPVDWEARELGDLCVNNPEYGANVSAIEFQEDLPRYVRITDINDNGTLISTGVKSIQKEDAENYLLSDGEIIFARSGATVGKTYLYNKSDGPCAFAGYTIRFKPNPSYLLPEFLFQFTHSNFYYQWVKGMLRAGAQPNVNGSEYSGLTLPIPPIKEQEGIVRILSSVDELVSKISEEIEKAQELKKGLMLNIFSKAEKTEKLSEICSVITKGSTPTTYGFEFTDNGVRFIKIESINTGGEINLKQAVYISEQAHAAFKRSILEKDDILFSIAGALGRTMLITEELLPANTNQALSILRLKKNMAYPRYVKYFLGSDAVRRYIKDVGTQGAQINLSLAQVGDIDVPLPSLSNQEEIIDTLSAIDADIKAAEKQLDATQNLKISLMNMLLTGKVRVN